MKSAVIEFHGFKDNDNEFVVKELAIVSDNFQTQLVFKAPYDRCLLNEKMQRTTRWLTRSFHKIRWEYGGVPYDMELIRSLCKPFATLYTRGLEKVRFLEHFHPDVKNLSTLFVNSNLSVDNVKITCSEDDTSRCLIHEHNIDNLDCKCALRSAIAGFRLVKSTQYAISSHGRRMGDVVQRT